MIHLNWLLANPMSLPFATLVALLATPSHPQPFANPADSHCPCWAYPTLPLPWVPLRHATCKDKRAKRLTLVPPVALQGVDCSRLPRRCGSLPVTPCLSPVLLLLALTWNCTLKLPRLKREQPEGTARPAPGDVAACPKPRMAAVRPLALSRLLTSARRCCLMLV